MSANDVSQSCIDASGDVACLLPPRVVSRLRVGEDARRDIMLLHVRESALDRPVGPLLPWSHRRTLPIWKDRMRVNVDNFTWTSHSTSLGNRAEPRRHLSSCPSCVGM